MHAAFMFTRVRPVFTLYTQLASGSVKGEYATKGYV